MRIRALQRFALLAACGLALASPSAASAETFFGLVNLSTPNASVGHPATANAFWPYQLLTVDEVCFHFTFAGDLLDPGDELTITPLDALPSMGGPGFLNSTQTAQSTRTLCVPNDGLHGPLPSLFLDGTEANIEIAALHGSVTISELRVSIRGVALLPFITQTVTLTFHGESGRTVTWGGEVVGETIIASMRLNGTVEGLHGTGQLTGSPPTALNAHFDRKGVGQLVVGSLTATRGSQRIAAKNMIGLAVPFGIDLFTRATYYDGRNTLFGDLSIRVALPAAD